MFGMYTCYSSCSRSQNRLTEHVSLDDYDVNRHFKQFLYMYIASVLVKTFENLMIKSLCQIKIDSQRAEPRMQSRKVG